MSATRMGNPTEVAPYAAEVVYSVVRAEVERRRRPKGKGWSIKFLCEQAKISERTLERWKAGGVEQVKWESLTAVRDAFGWDEDTLLTRLAEEQARWSETRSAQGGAASAVTTAARGAGSAVAFRPSESVEPAVVLGGPVEREVDFVGRGHERDAILGAIGLRQAVQILGEPLMGKTSLLRWAERHAAGDRPVVRVQATRGMSPAGLMREVAASLGHAEETRSLERPGATGHDAAVVLGRLPAFVLLLDEADTMALHGRGFDADFFSALRARADAGALTWISAARHDLFRLFKDQGLSSAFLNNARKVWVGLLDEASADRLAGRDVSEDVAAALRACAGRFAFGLQWLSQRVRDGADVDDARDAFAEEMEGGVFGRWWEGLDEKERAVLRKCGQGVVRSALSDAERRTAVRLCERGLVVKREDGWFSVDGECWREMVSRAG